jgi:FAD dependent oxidoreductase
MKRFSGFNLIGEAFRSHQGWPEHWPDKAPKATYDAIIVGAGGHGLGAAYYLAKKYGITNVAVIEKGWLGVATPAAIPRSSARTTSTMRARISMITRSSCGMG